MHASPGLGTLGAIGRHSETRWDATPPPNKWTHKLPRRRQWAPWRPGGRGRPPLAPDQRKTKVDKAKAKKDRRKERRDGQTEEETQAEKDLLNEARRKRKREKREREGRTVI